MKGTRKGIYPIIAFILGFLAFSCVNLSDDTKYTPEREKQLLTEYLAELVSKGYNVDTTALGVYYVTVESGSGPYPQAGDTLSVIYSGYLLSGGMFDTSLYHSTDSTWHFVYKEIDVIRGWDDAMSIMQPGSKMRFILPSSLAYGANGVPGVIPPYSALIYDAILRNIKPPQ